MFLATQLWIRIRERGRENHYAEKKDGAEGNIRDSPFRMYGDPLLFWWQGQLLISPPGSCTEHDGGQSHHPAPLLSGPLLASSLPANDTIASRTCFTPFPHPKLAQSLQWDLPVNAP